MMTPVSPWQESIGFPILSLMIAVPVVGMIALYYAKSAHTAIRTGLTVATVNFLLSLYLAAKFDNAKNGIQFAEHYSLFGLNYSVGVDGLNVLFIPLATCTAWLVLVFISAIKSANNKTMIMSLLGYEAILLAAFCALNLMQFWLVMVLELFVFINLILRTGIDEKKRYLAVRMVQFFGSSLLLTLTGFLLLAFGLIDSEHDLTFDLLTLKDNNAYLHDEILIFILLFYGFAIRMPLFPFHGWLPLLAEQNSVTGLTILIAGVKLGIYASIRFIFPLVPGVAEQWANFVILLCLISIFYGALLAFMQKNIYRLLAFAVLSHTGALVFGIYSFNKHGLEGTLLLSMVYGLAMTGKFISSRLINEQTGTAMIPRLGDLFDTHTTLGLLFLITALSTMIMPGSLGFDAGHLLLEGVVEEHEWFIATTILLGNVMAAGFLLWAFQRIFLASSKRCFKYGRQSHSVLQERLITLVICSLHVGAGLNSYFLFNLIDQEVNDLVSQYPVHSSLRDMENEMSPEAAPVDGSTQDNEGIPRE
jgi:NADH-quinone oxidoreductase subunit M